jgi:aryl-alcohol dehydrogenase-like predicted oxidoreductase
MKKRPLGTTGLSISEIGFGCGGNAGLMVKGTPEQQRAAVSTALELGIDYFDTAPVYGDTASERNLGATLRSLGARPVVATKVVLELEDLDDIPRAVARSVEHSLERLQKESVELVHLHNRVASRREAKSDIGVGAMLTVPDVLGPRGVLTGFHQLRKRGLVRHFGCCAFGGEMHAVRSLIDSGAFANLLVHYSLVNQTAWLPASGGERDYEGIGAYAAARGVGSSALRILEGGALSGERHALARGPNSPEQLLIAERARALAGAEATNFVRRAMRFALDNADLSTVLVGFSDAEQVRQAAAIASERRLPRTAIRHMGKGAL